MCTAAQLNLIQKKMAMQYHSVYGDDIDRILLYGSYARGDNTEDSDIDIVAIAKACGYPSAVSVDSFEDLDKALTEAKNRNALSLVEVKCSLGAREDLGRPTTTAIENKNSFMEYLKSDSYL